MIRNQLAVLMYKYDHFDKATQYTIIAKQIQNKSSKQP